MLDAMKVGVLMGGVSGEREVSLISGGQASAALRRKGLNVVDIDIATSHPDEVREQMRASCIDLAFVALHGEFGEDGGIQEILDELAMPYTGSGALASRKAMDKLLSKELFTRAAVPTPQFCVLSSRTAVPQDIEYPVVIKPSASGSSLGVSIVRDASGFLPAVQKAFACKGRVMMEHYIAGRELTVGILDDSPLAVVEIRPRSQYYDYNAKYNDDRTEFIAPARLDEKMYKFVQGTALRAHRALGCRHFSRVDIRLGEDHVAYVLEVNSIPGLTSHSLLPLSAKVCGIDFDELILTMARLALNEKKQPQEV